MWFAHTHSHTPFDTQLYHVKREMDAHEATLREARAALEGAQGREGEAEAGIALKKAEQATLHREVREYVGM